MPHPNSSLTLEQQIETWRGYLRRRQSINASELAKLEVQLRDQVAALTETGLSVDEAFLVAVKRIGDRDPHAREFAREHSERLWRQLIALPSDRAAERSWGGKDAIVAFGLAVAAAIAVKLPELFGLKLGQDEGFYARNISFFVLPFLTGYFVWKRQLAAPTVLGLGIGFVAAAIVANIYTVGSTLEVLMALHLPIALWLAVGVAHAGGRWGESAGRMDFIRFSGELFIYYVLIALGGGVFCAFMALTFQAIGIDIERFFESWLLPCGALGAVVIASWLVEAKQGVMESMAPLLTKLFTPLFAIMLVAFVGTVAWSGRGVDIGRELLIGFDLLLVVVLGLLVYSVSARDPSSPPAAFDVLQVILVVAALIADAIALWAIGARINEFGFSPNRVAALGENVILLVNLAWSVVLYARFLLGRGSFKTLEKWQTDYIPIYAIWAAVVVVIFPLIFP